MERARLVARLREIGVVDPDDAADAVAAGDRSALAAALVLHMIWVNAIDPWHDDAPRLLGETRDVEDGEPFSDAARALERVLASGADPEDLGRFARAVAYRASFDTFFAVGGGFWEPEVDDLWELAGEETFARLGDLHEGILSADPSGREGSPPA